MTVTVAKTKFIKLATSSVAVAFAETISDELMTSVAMTVSKTIFNELATSSVAVAVTDGKWLAS